MPTISISRSAAGACAASGHSGVIALLIALPMAVAAVMLVRSGIETRGRRLEEIQNALSASRAYPE